MRSQERSFDILVRYYQCEDNLGKLSKMQERITDLERKIKRIQDTVEEISAQLPPKIGVEVTVVPSDSHLSPQKGRNMMNMEFNTTLYIDQYNNMLRWFIQFPVSVEQPMGLLKVSSNIKRLFLFFLEVIEAVICFQLLSEKKSTGITPEKPSHYKGLCPTSISPNNCILYKKLYGMCIHQCNVMKKNNVFPENDQFMSPFECCPLWSGDGTPCGEATGRGLCRDIQISQAPYGPDQSLDENDVRTRWPRAFYNRTCTCTGNFYGPDCGECWFGWEDPSCLKRRELTRRNVLSLSAMDRSRLMAYINLAKVTVNPTYCILVTPPGPNGSLPIFANASYYDVFVWMHYFASQRKDDSTGPDYAHEGAGFLPWHRLFLLSWERALQRVSGDLTLSLPYWDWRDAENCQVCTDDLFGAYRLSESGSISSGSIFAAWQITCTRDAEYASQGMFCAGKGEGPLE
uniref:tyrosinase-like n=1 Tax=Myxine glutinosa TaxID=7769 RepID=UPI00359006F0